MGIFDKSKTVVSDNLEQSISKSQEDWTLIIATCDSVNASDSGAKEAAKFIRKKLKGSNSNPTLQLRCLVVLKSLAENCGAKFHAEIASKKFLDDIETVAVSQSTDVNVKKSIISLLGSLSTMFDSEPSLYQVENLYNKLRGTQALGRTFAERGPQWNFSKVQIAEDIELAKNNATLLTQTLSFTDPEKEDITKNELIQEFYAKCKTLQKSIGSYLSEIQDEQWLNSLISVNQELLSAFKMYDEMIERGQIGQAKLQSNQQQNNNLIILNDYEAGPSVPRDPFADPEPVKSEKAKGKERALDSIDDNMTNGSSLSQPIRPYHINHKSDSHDLGGDNDQTIHPNDLGNLSTPRRQEHISI